MSKLSSLPRSHQWLAGAVTVLALVAVCLSSYLTWVTWQQSAAAGCTGASAASCDEVLASAGSKWLGIPVSLFGALTYGGILALIWPAVLWGGWAMILFLSLAMLAAGSGIWFIGTQALVVQHFCMYCMTIHACGLAICALAFALVRSRASEPHYDAMRAMFTGDTADYEPPRASDVYQPLIASAIAAVGLAALVGGQMLFAPSGMEVIDELPLQVVDEQDSAEAASDAVVQDEAVEPTSEMAEPISEPDEPAAEAVVVSDEETAPQQTTNPLEETTEADPGDVAFELFDEPEADNIEEAVTEATSTPTEPSGDETIATDASREAPVERQYEFDESLFANTAPSTVVQEAAKPVLDELPSVGRVFRFRTLQREIDVEANPVMGNPYAPHRMVEMLDYTCPHCRKLHPYIHKAIERYGDQVGFVIYHVPLSRKCNPMVQVDQTSHRNACEYSKLAYGVWKVDRTKFVEYHDWLMTGDKAPPVYEAKKRAMELVGEAILLDKTIPAEFGQRVADAAAELEPMKVGLPLLIFNQGVIRGMPESEQEWFQVLESRLGVTPVATVVN